MWRWRERQGKKELREEHERKIRRRKESSLCIWTWSWTFLSDSHGDKNEWRKEGETWDVSSLSPSENDDLMPLLSISLSSWRTKLMQLTKREMKERNMVSECSILSVCLSFTLLLHSFHLHHSLLLMMMIFRQQIVKANQTLIMSHSRDPLSVSFTCLRLRIKEREREREWNRDLKSNKMMLFKSKLRGFLLILKRSKKLVLSLFLPKLNLISISIQFWRMQLLFSQQESDFWIRRRENFSLFYYHSFGNIYIFIPSTRSILRELNKVNVSRCPFKSSYHLYMYQVGASSQNFWLGSRLLQSERQKGRRGGGDGDGETRELRNRDGKRQKLRG